MFRTCQSKDEYYIYNYGIWSSLGVASFFGVNLHKAIALTPQFRHRSTFIMCEMSGQSNIYNQLIHTYTALVIHMFEHI